VSLPDFKTTVRTWLTTALGVGVTDVDYGYQDAPELATPYAQIRTIALASMGQADVDMHPDALGDRNVRQWYRATLSCHFHGATALTLASDAHAALSTEDIKALFVAAGYGVLGTTGLTRLPEIVGTKWEDRWQFDLFLHVEAEESENVGWIEKAQIRMILKDIDGTTAADTTFVTPI